MSELGDEPSGRAQRRPAGGPAGHRAAPRSCARSERRPAADARGALLGRPRRDRGDRPPPAAGAGDRRHPLGRRGNARPDRPPGALGARPAAARLPRPRRAARAAARLGRRAPQRDDDLAGAADRRRDAGAGRGADAGRRQRRRRDVVPAGRRALRRQPAVRRGDGQPPARGGHGRGRRRCRAPSSRCSPPASTRSTGSSAGCSSRLGGRPDLLGGLRSRRPRHEEGLDLGDTLASAGGEGPARPEPGQPPGRRARVRLQARADPRRRLRDAAQGGPLPQARRGRRVHPRARRRAQRRRSSAWSPSTTPAPRRSASEAGLERRRARRASGARRWSCSRPPATLPPPSTRTPRRSTATPPRSSSPTSSTRRSWRGSARSRATSRCAWAASTRRSASGSAASTYHRAEEDLARVADLHRKIGAALWHKGERRASIDNYQRGIDLLKDGPPCIELVRLYEEAASLYMHTGDNMLAIYASEKALRLAERLDEARAASRAHGIFGRVFGRIGDSEKARENLERSVALARESDRGEAVRALLTLGYHLEVSEADYEGAAEAYREALELAQEVGDLPSQVELHASLGQLAVHAGRLGRGRARDRGERQARRARGPARKALLPLPDARRARLAARASGTTRSATTAAPTSWASRWAAPRSPSQRSSGSPPTLRDSGDLAGAETELAKALDICERAGLIAQSVEAISARAVVLALAGRDGAGAGGRGGGRAARRAPPLPGRPGRQGRGGGSLRRGPRGRAELMEQARASAGSSWDARSTRPAACWCAAGCWRDRPEPPASCSSAAAPSTRRSACPGSPRGRGSWSPADGVLEAAGADRGARRASLGAARDPRELRLGADVLEVTGAPTRIEKGSTFEHHRPRAPAAEGHDDLQGRGARRPARDQAALPGSGFYSHWLLTEAQGRPSPRSSSASSRSACTDAWRALHTKSYLRQVTEKLLDGLRRAASGERRGRYIESCRDRERPTRLDPHRLAGELPDQRRARLRRDRVQGAPPPTGRGVRAGRRDLLLRHRRPGVRGNRPGDARRCSRTAPRSGPGQEGQARALSLAGRGRAGRSSCPRRSSSPPRSWSPSSSTSRKWPREHWHLAFQGQLRTIGEADAAAAPRAPRPRSRRGPDVSDEGTEARPRAPLHRGGGERAAAAADAAARPAAGRQGRAHRHRGPRGALRGRTDERRRRAGQAGRASPSSR